MSDTFGSLVDKLATQNQKLFMFQEEFYKARRLSYEEFKAAYIDDDNGGRKLFEALKNAMDLNVQRSAIIKELDQKLLEIIQAAIKGEELDNGSFVQDQHKTY